ncbi:heterokaryon incompatibility protein-domain-containing protein [Xylariaceae sp. AK1471]|nr:heterokaryon incompatibility protein-domain-containing protein [Xylariaceae sp. AK1471]
MQYPRSRLLFYLVDFTALLLITGILYAFRQSLWVEIHRAKVVFSNVKVNYGSSPKGWKFLEYSMSPCRIRGDGGLPGPNCIRLVRVEIAEDGGLDIRHESFLLASAPPYRALSYTWGPAEGRPEDADFVYRFMDKHNEQRSMPKNLVKALHRIRELDENKWYWIDFICIKQDHLRERGEQVSNMHNIYQQASAVDVWLGDASQDDVANVNRVLQDLVEHGRWEAKIRTGLPQNLSSPITISVIPQHILPEEDWDILIPFLSRRWFHRLWTLQEFSLAKRARVLYGKGFIDDTILAEAVSFLTNHSIPIEIQHGNHDAAGIAVHQRFLLKKHLLDVKLTAGFLPPFALNQGLPNYEALLALTYWHSTATTATDPRDYIYGITGIANVIMDRLLRDEVCRLRACPAYQPFKVDYTLTTAEVFKQFIVRLMHGSLGIRATTLMQKSVHNEKYDRPDHQRQRRAVASWEDSERELPSWVPNLANRRLSPLSIRNILEPYNQSARAPNVFGSPHLITQQFQILANDLHVFGHRIGRVEKHSSPFPSAYELAPCAEFGLLKAF